MSVCITCAALAFLRCHHAGTAIPLPAFQRILLSAVTASAHGIANIAMKNKIFRPSHRIIVHGEEREWRYMPTALIASPIQVMAIATVARRP